MEEKPKITPIKEGDLSFNIRWQLIESRKKAPGLIEGKHLIMQIIKDGEPIKSCKINFAVAMEAYGIARSIALEMQAYEGGFRIFENGPGLCTRDHFHLHIVLPTKNDNLEPIVKREEKN